MNRISLNEQIIFIKRLSILIRTGIPLLQSLEMIRNHSTSKTLSRVLDQVVKDVSNGQNLSAGLRRFHKIFGEFTINIIEIGEVSGTLAENLDYLAVELKKKQTLRRKIISALIYPVFIIIATFGITIMLTVFLFPKLLPIFRSVNFDLPWSTKILIFFSNILVHNSLLIFTGIIAIIAAIGFLFRLPKFRFVAQQLILKLPFLGSLSQGYNLANICRGFGILLRSNVVIVKTAKINARVTENLVYKLHLDQIADKIARGERISVHFQTQPKLFPMIMRQMVMVGESSGNLSETFLYLAQVYEEEVDEMTKNLSTVLEPVLLILMGLLVGFIAISIITPIYGITQHIHP
jgi:type IV pilus assembly protein PilC